MPTKKETEKQLDYAKGYRDALVDTWESVIKLATKGYSSRELQIMSKTQSLESRQQIEAKISELEADFAQDDIIEAEDIKVIHQTEPKPIIAVNLRPGMSYMIREPKPSRCYKMFEKEIAAGKTGLCVSRQSPREVRDNYKIGRSRVIWLSLYEKQDAPLPPSALGMITDDSFQADANDVYVQPAALPVLFSHITNFLDGNPGGIVVLDGLEYLTSHTKFQSLMNFLQMINEHIKQTGSYLLLSANPQAFDDRQFSQLETEMSQVL
ncbi:MAG: DUF835 domain-containing protein [Thermoplasmata archaeon]|nr:DUF835 domain-containing protein [Thermoplasmata archaeon]